MKRIICWWDRHDVKVLVALALAAILLRLMLRLH
jgi:hypothetical protein